MPIPNAAHFIICEETVRALIETFPMVSRLKMLRHWGGIVDVTGDRSPILSQNPFGQYVYQLRLGHRRVQSHPGFGLGLGRAYGEGERPLTDRFGLDRFRAGRFIDESVAAGVAH